MASAEVFTTSTGFSLSKADRLEIQFLLSSPLAFCIPSANLSTSSKVL